MYHWMWWASPTCGCWRQSVKRRVHLESLGLMPFRLFPMFVAPLLFCLGMVWWSVVDFLFLVWPMGFANFWMSSTFFNVASDDDVWCLACFACFDLDFVPSLSLSCLSHRASWFLRCVRKTLSSSTSFPLARTFRKVESCLYQRH